jgi:hypothetical protein
MTWLLVRIRPSPRTMTPEPSDCCTRWRIWGETPKNCWNRGSAKSGFDGACTTERA